MPDENEGQVEQQEGAAQNGGPGTGAELPTGTPAPEGGATDGAAQVSGEQPSSE